MDKEDVDTTLLSDTLQSIGLGESSVGRGKVLLQKKPMDLCPSKSGDLIYVCLL